MRKWILFAVLGLLIILLLIYLPKKKSSNNSESSGTPLTQFKKKEESMVRLMLVGDIMLGRSVNIRSLDKKDPTYPFTLVADRLRRADIVFANLETPIIEDCPRLEHGFTFCADPKMVKGLTFSGIDVVSLANNHTRNFGNKGFEETKKYLSDAGIKWVGDGNFEIIEKGGVKFGFLGFDFTVKRPVSADYELIKKVNEEAGILIAGVHWGEEYKSEASKDQRQIAENMVDAGVDVIAGHHPHWVQNSEVINGKRAYYSLGNFIFDQMWSEETRKGLAVELTYKTGFPESEKKLPTYIKNWAQPKWVE